MTTQQLTHLTFTVTPTTAELGEAYTIAAANAAAAAREMNLHTLDEGYKVDEWLEYVNAWNVAEDIKEAAYEAWNNAKALDTLAAITAEFAALVGDRKASAFLAELETASLPVKIEWMRRHLENEQRNRAIRSMYLSNPRKSRLFK